MKEKTTPRTTKREVGGFHQQLRYHCGILSRFSRFDCDAGV